MTGARRSLAALLLTLSSCDLNLQNRTETRWTGQLTSDNAQCAPSRGVLTLREGVAVFAPDEGVWVLSGTVVGNHITANRTRPGQGNKSYVTSMHAERSGAAIGGAYNTPTCEYHFGLHQF